MNSSDVETMREELSIIDRLVSGHAVVKKASDWKGGATLRFDNGAACCTCTYNYSMPDERRVALARRIAAALNATRGFTTEQLEACRAISFKGCQAMAIGPETKE